MRRSIVLLLLAAVVGLPSVAFADAQTIDFRCIFAYCHSRFYALAGVTFYDPTTADWTVEGGLGILDADEMGILQLILANPAAPHHAGVHAAFALNCSKARAAIGTTIVNLTTSPNTDGPMARQPIPNTTPVKYYAADGLMGAYLTMGEWMLYDTTMAAFKDSEFGSRVLWTVNTGEHEALRTTYDLTQADYVNMCGDLDGDTVKNCNEFWAATPNSYAGALNPAVTAGVAIWSSWTCLDENNSSYRFIYNPDTERVYMTSPTELTWDEALAFTVQYPGGASLPTSMVTIRNASENAYVKTLGNANTVWIGCTDVAKDGPAHAVPNDVDWYWLSDPTQSVMTYHNWNHPPHGTGSEPNGINHGEDCGTMRDDGTWNDVNKLSGTPPTPRTYYAIFETTGTWPDADDNGAPDDFEDKNGDLIPDGFGIPQPSADFSADDLDGGMPLTVHFTDLSDPGEPVPGDPDPVITSWLWNFGDNETSIEQHPTHTYMAADPFTNYTVSLTIITVNNPPDDVRTDTMIKTGYIHVVYVCPFEDQMSEQGGLLNDAIMAATPALFGGVKDDLTAAVMTTWETWDIERLPAADPGDGLLDAAQIALIEFVACSTWMDANAVTFVGMTTNKGLFETDMATLAGDFAGLAAYADVFAGLIGSSQEMKDTVDQMFITMGAAGGLPSYDEYVVFEDGKGDELFSATGDVDGDSKTNKDEYDEVVLNGGGLGSFLIAATDPNDFYPENPLLPVAGILGLGLLAGSLLAGAALGFRKK